MSSLCATVTRSAPRDGDRARRVDAVRARDRASLRVDALVDPRQGRVAAHVGDRAAGEQAERGRAQVEQELAPDRLADVAALRRMHPGLSQKLAQFAYAR